MVDEEDAGGPSEELRADLGKRLAAARIAVGLSVDDIAGRLNLRASFIVAVEEGRGDTHMDWAYERNHIRAIAGILAVELPEVMGGASGAS